VLVGERGAVVTVNAGETWSSSSNQPTARFYRVSADNAFPYRVCGGQQENGSACVASRSDRGRITVRDWLPVAAEDYGSVAPDPLDPDIVYGGRLTRYDRRTGQAQDVMPPRDRVARVLRTAPLLFSPRDPRALFFGADALWRTADGGERWTAISPAQGGAAVQTVAISPIDDAIIWLGTDDGQIRVTRDGGRTWMDATPSQLAPWASVSSLEASHFDVNTAYAAVNASRLDDRRPYVYRTRDGGRRWSLAAGELPADAPVNSVKEDIQRRGLLFAGTERAAYVSFDDGDHWQSLRLNMPATSVRDLVVKDDDLVIATQGRGFWILDDLVPLRQITEDIVKAGAYLFRPPTAWRARWRGQADTLPSPDEPAAPNPPEGVTVSYLLGPDASGPVTLEVIETLTDTVLRRYSSDDEENPLPTMPGLHRIVWDVRLAPPDGSPVPVATRDTIESTAASPRGAWVLPGTYQVRLTTAGRVLRQAVLVKMDPRVKTPVADLTAQLELSKLLAEAMRDLSEARRAVRQRLAEAGAQAGAALRAAAAALEEAYAPMPTLFSRIQEVDARPTEATEAAAAAALEKARAALARFTAS
jgi:photosystem II stability/assembly factor-like uncharacterized protein